MMHRWGLRRKILAGYGLVLLLICVVFGWAVHNLLLLGRASDAILSENYRSILAAENMIDALERQDSGVLLYILGFNLEGTQQFHDNAEEFNSWLRRAQDNITIEGEADVIGRIDSAHAAYRDLFRLVTSARKDSQSVNRYHDVLLPAFLDVRKSNTELRDMNQHTMYTASQEARRVAHTAIGSMTVVSAFAFGLALLFSIVLSNKIVHPIRSMRSAALEIARGNYEVTVSPGGSDELGQLAEQFAEMTSKLRMYRDLNVEQIVAEKRKGEAIIRSIDDGIVTVDAALCIASLNPTACRALGLDPDEAIGKRLDDMVQNTWLFNKVRETLTSGRQLAIEEDDALLGISHAGQESYFQYAVTPVYTPAGTMLGAIVLLRDVTNMKKLDQIKSQFVATASHELKTPLTSIGMSISLLSERLSERLNPGEKELLDVAGIEIGRLRNLVNDLLDLAKIEAGRIDLNVDDVSVGLIFKRAIQALTTEADARSIALTMDAYDVIPPVRGDPDKITWVLTNLISNALRFSSSGGHINLSAKHIGTMVQLSVSDDGEGIPNEYQSKIFEKFVQVDGRGAEGGSGLGLAICKEVIRVHGGSIWVESTPGNGSTFHFTLPLSV